MLNSALILVYKNEEKWLGIVEESLGNFREMKKEGGTVNAERETSRTPSSSPCEILHVYTKCGFIIRVTKLSLFLSPYNDD